MEYVRVELLQARSVHMGNGATIAQDKGDVIQVDKATAYRMVEKQQCRFVDEVETTDAGQKLDVKKKRGRGRPPGSRNVKSPLQPPAE